MSNMYLIIVHIADGVSRTEDEKSSTNKKSKTSKTVFKPQIKTLEKKALLASKNTKNCFNCAGQFKLFSRKRNCKICGKVF